MTFWEIIASNAIVATILAGVALLLVRFWKNAAAVHVVWVVVLLKLFTPPLVTTGLPIPSPFSTTEVRVDSVPNLGNKPSASQAGPSPGTSKPSPRGEANGVVEQQPTQEKFDGSSRPEPWSPGTILGAIWIVGSTGLAVVQGGRIRRFCQVLRNSEPAPPAILAMVAALSSRLGLRRVPDVLMTSGVLPPLIWSVGSSPRVLLPSALFARLGGEARKTILAHELSHIRRGDHLVRVLELAATTVFWWHPVVWWASRHLRELEEECCDGRVLELVPDQPRTYAEALVDTLEFLSERPRSFVPLRTAIDSTGSLSRRIQMLTRSRSRTRTNRLTALSTSVVLALVAIPMVVAFAVDPEPRQAADSQAATLRGRVTNEAGAPLAEARVVVAIPATDMRFVDTSTSHKLIEAKSDANGNYRLEIPGLKALTKISVDAKKPGYRRLWGTLMMGGDDLRVDVEPGKTADASMILKPALYYAGMVVDEQGKPIAGVEISANDNTERSSGGVERTASRPDGSFELFNYSQELRAIQGEPSKGAVEFEHPHYIVQEIEDLYATAKRERETLRVVLQKGHTLTGTVLDAAGKPVPNVMVKVVRKDESHRKATMTDASGNFALRGLSSGLSSLSVLALDIKQKQHLLMAINADKPNMEVRLQSIPMPADVKTYEILGMKLTDVTPAWQSAYDLWNGDGILILEPGKDSDRLGIGQLVEGYSFWMVGEKGVANVREFVDQILLEAAGQGAGPYSIRVVYNFTTVEFDGTNTQYMKLNAEDLKPLRELSERLKPVER